MKSKKMKQALASLCVGAMVISGVNFPVNVLSADAAEQVQNELQNEVLELANGSIVVGKGTKEIDSKVLRENAKANSEQSDAQGHGAGNDGPAKWAFDDANHWWHSRYQGNAQSGEVSNGLVSESNKIWIQTGFGESKKIKKVTYAPRTDVSYGRINKYELQVANKSNPSNSDFQTVKSGNFANDNTVKTIELNSSTPATHIRLVVSSVYGNGGTAHVAAKRIRVYEEGNVQYDVNKQADFWEYELLNGNLSEQIESDRWHYQIKENGKWKDLPANAYKVNAGAWMNNGSQDSTYFWAKLSKNEITTTLSNAAHQAVGFSWKAKNKGYYKATLERNMTGGNDKLDFVIGHAKANDSSDGKILLRETLGNGQNFTSKIAKVDVGDFIRIGATKKNAWAQNFLPMVVEVTAQDYAKQYLGEVANVENGVESSQELKNAVVAARTALSDAANTENPDMSDIENKITALEKAIEAMKSYVAVTNVVLNKQTLSLLIGNTETLTATVNPSNATDKELQWSSDKPDVADVDENGTVTAKKAGNAVITVQSTAYPNIEAKCTVVVTRNDTELNKVIGLAQQKKAEADYNEKYTEASRKDFEAALEAALEVQKDSLIPLEEAKQAVKDLTDALANLKEKFSVTIKNGDATEKKYYEFGERVTVVAKPAPEGKKFSHWAMNGTPTSYKETYTFVVIANNTVVETNYVKKDEVVEQEATIMCTSFYNTSTHEATFTAKRALPAGCKVIEHGVIMTDSTGWKNLGNEGFVLDAQRTVKNTGKEKWMLGNYTCYMKSTRETTWYGKGYVKYMDKEGRTNILYSEVTSCKVIK